jgi:hypothetical protein
MVFTFMRTSSMVVNNLDIVCTVVSPDKAQAPLLIDTDRMLILTCAPQRFKSVAWQSGQIGKQGSTVENLQTPLSLGPEAVKPAHTPAAEKRFGVFVVKRMKHLAASYEVSEGKGV